MSCCRVKLFCTTASSGNVIAKDTYTKTMEPCSTEDKPPGIKVYLLVLFGIILPATESVSGTLWGLALHSPEFMSSVSDYVRVIKFIVVGASLYFLPYVNSTEVVHAFPNAVLRWSIMSTTYFVGIGQLVLLGLGIVFNSVSMTNEIPEHYEERIGQRVIYRHIVDPGAFGKASATFYLKCPQAFGRYSLQYIGSSHWARAYELAIEDEELIVTSPQQPDFHFAFNLTGKHCES